MRDNILAIGQIYHVFTKSIAGFKIFNDETEFRRMAQIVSYYQKRETKFSFSRYLKLSPTPIEIPVVFNEGKQVEIIAYCFMPTHIHLILKQLHDNSISIFMRNILNSYTRYFNIRHNRKGPLWETRFRHVLLGSDEQLLHLTRYIHLNPVTAYLVNKPELWLASSYREYLNNYNDERICKYEEILDIDSIFYREFVEDRISYQRELAKIKALIIE